MQAYRKEIEIDKHKKFVVTLSGRTLTSVYVSNHPALNISRYTLHLRVELDEEAFRGCVIEAAANFVKLKKKGQKKVHSLFVKLLVIAIARATNSPIHYVVQEITKETELAYRQPRKQVLSLEDFLRDAYLWKKRVEELEAEV